MFSDWRDAKARRAHWEGMKRCTLMMLEEKGCENRSQRRPMLSMIEPLSSSMMSLIEYNLDDMVNHFSPELSQTLKNSVNRIQDGSFERPMACRLLLIVAETTAAVEGLEESFPSLSLSKVRRCPNIHGSAEECFPDVVRYCLRTPIAWWHFIDYKISENNDAPCLTVILSTMKDIPFPSNSK